MELLCSTLAYSKSEEFSEVESKEETKTKGRSAKWSNIVILYRPAEQRWQTRAQAKRMIQIDWDVWERRRRRRQEPSAQLTWHNLLYNSVQSHIRTQQYFTLYTIKNELPVDFWGQVNMKINWQLVLGDCTKWSWREVHMRMRRHELQYKCF